MLISLIKMYVWIVSCDFGKPVIFVLHFHYVFCFFAPLLIFNARTTKFMITEGL